MTEREINIVIAEFCGWEILREVMMPTDILCGRKAGVGDGDWTPIPNYCRDLDAIHEAEKTLTTFQLNVYVCLLGQLPQETMLEDIVRVVTTTAAQRAKAFLRTLGKWSDSSDDKNALAAAKCL